MDAISKKLSKVALELHWKPKSIENIEKTFRTLEGRHRFKFLVTGQLTGMHLWWNTETKSKSFVLVGRCKNKTFSHTCGKYIPGTTKLSDIENYVAELCNKYKDRNGHWIKILI